MPFRDSDLQEIPPNPEVKIFLHGQLILAPEEDGDACVVGVNRCSPSHQFSLEVRQRMLDPDIPDIILMRRLGTLELDVEIAFDDSLNEGVTRFVPAAPHGHVNHFAWLIDWGGPVFHDCAVKLRGADIEPGVIIREGLFYTAARTDESRLRVTRARGGKDTLNLGSVAAIMGVNIYLEGRKLKVGYTQEGDEQFLMLPPSDAPPNVKHYEIRIINDPPFTDPEDELPTHDEFREFYKAVDHLERDGVREYDFLKFQLNLERIQSPGLGSPRIPCMPIGSGTSD